VPYYLRIDGDFIPNDKADARQWMFVKMINDIADRLQIECIAECVEDEFTLKKPSQIGVLFGKASISAVPDPLSRKHGKQDFGAERFGILRILMVDDNIAVVESFRSCLPLSSIGSEGNSFRMT
jgi:hypothetical protein